MIKEYGARANHLAMGAPRPRAVLGHISSFMGPSMTPPAGFRRTNTSSRTNGSKGSGTDLSASPEIGLLYVSKQTKIGF